MAAIVVPRLWRTTRTSPTGPWEKESTTRRAASTVGGGNVKGVPSEEEEASREESAEAEASSDDCGVWGCRVLSPSPAQTRSETPSTAIIRAGMRARKAMPRLPLTALTVEARGSISGVTGVGRVRLLSSRARAD